jgi:hypothetical protein
MLATTSALPDVTAWSRLAEEGANEGARTRFELRAGLRDVTTSDRTAACGVRCIERHGECADLTLTARGNGWRAKWRGILFCGRIWTCPVCSAKKRALRALAVDDALRASEGRWQMVTLTVRHQRGMPMAKTFEVLRKAWRRLKMGGAVQRIMHERVSASIRAWEVTQGDAGWHPHVHCLWKTDAWTESERDLLLRRWRQCVREVAPECEPDDVHAIVWSDP